MGTAVKQELAHLCFHVEDFEFFFFLLTFHRYPPTSSCAIAIVHINIKKIKNTTRHSAHLTVKVVNGPLHPRLPQVSGPVRLVVPTVPVPIVLFVSREHDAQAHNPI